LFFKVNKSLAQLLLHRMTCCKWWLKISHGLPRNQVMKKMLKITIALLAVFFLAAPVWIAETQGDGDFGQESDRPANSSADSAAERATHDYGRQASSVARSVMVPEPGALAVLGIGLLGLATGIRIAQRNSKRRASSIEGN
jgi:hypothetical protein